MPRDTELYDYQGWESIDQELARLRKLREEKIKKFLSLKNIDPQDFNDFKVFHIGSNGQNSNEFSLKEKIKYTFTEVAGSPRNYNFGLRSLSLSNVNLSKSDIINVSTFLKSFSLLEELHVDQNPLGGKHVWRFSWWLFNQTSGLEVLSSALYGHQNLKKLSLREVGIDSKDSIALQVTLDSLKSLVEFNFTEEELDIDASERLKGSIKKTQERAELLGFQLPDHLEGSLTQGIRQGLNHYIASNCDEEVKGEYDSRWLYDFTCSLVKVFVPEDARKQFLQNKTKNNEPLNRFEGLQWRALNADSSLRELMAAVNNPQQEEENIGTIKEIWARFIIDLNLESDFSDSDHIPIIENALQDWLKVCVLAHDKSRLENPATSTSLCFSERQDESDFIGAQWFHARFHWTLSALWAAAAVNYSGLMAISNPLLKREQVTQHLKEAAFHALLAIPAIGELGHTLFHGVKALHAAGNAEFLKEIAHTAEFAGSLGECLEDIPTMQHSLHKVSRLPRKVVENLTRKQWLNTKERLDNLYKSFLGLNDFETKILGLTSKIIHHFGLQLRELEPREAGRLGQACAKHIAQALMLGLLRRDIPLSVERFISQAFHWLAYIPMESPPLLKLQSGSYLSSDTLLRGAGLIGYDVNERQIYFHWENFEINALDDYAPYLYRETTFRYQAMTELAGYRLADEIEVAHFNQLLSQGQEPESACSTDNVVLRQKANKQIARLTLNTSAQVLAALREKGITSVIATTEPWKPDKKRLSILENKIKEQGEAIKERDKTIRELERRVNQLENNSQPTSSRVAAERVNQPENNSRPASPRVANAATLFAVNDTNQSASTGEMQNQMRMRHRGRSHGSN